MILLLEHSNEDTRLLWNTTKEKKTKNVEEKGEAFLITSNSMILFMNSDDNYLHGSKRNLIFAKE